MNENETLRLLVAAGVSDKAAGALAQLYDFARCREVVQYARDTQARNPGGLICKALEDRWKVPRVLPEEERHSPPDAGGGGAQRSHRFHKWRPLRLWGESLWEHRERVLRWKKDHATKKLR